MISALLATTLAALPPVGVVMFGQSNGIGNTSVPAKSTVRPGNSCFWSGNVLNSTYMDIDTKTPDTCVPLVEATYEMPRTAMAQKYIADTGAAGMFVANVCQGGAGYTTIKRGTAQWSKLISMVEAYGSRNAVGGRFLGFVVHHGENDDSGGATRATYKGFMVELQTDATALLQRVSLPVRPGAQFPIYMTQFSKFAAYGRTATTVAMAQLEAADENPGKIVLVGPKYQYTYIDAVHLDADGYQRMATKVGQALAYGPDWKPLSMESATLSGSTVRVCFHVPFPPLVLDTTSMSNAGNYGLQYTCGDAPPPISSVTPFGTDCVDAVLSSQPSPTCQLSDKVTYAFDGTVSGRGNVRDQDPNGATHWSLYNWAAHEEENVQ